MNRCFWVLLMMVTMMVSTIQAGPFGFTMGMSLREVKAIDGIVVKSETYRSYATVLQVANPPADIFDMYVLLFSNRGLYKIIASSTIRTKNDGRNLAREYFIMREYLKRVYGAFQEQELLIDETGPIPESFMGMLKKKKVKIFSFWPKDKKMKLVDHVRTAVLEISAYSLYTGTLVLTIEFTNSTQ